MQWIKEVELVDSVDDLKSSRSIQGTPGPDFELLDARIASALNKIIQNTRFKKKGQSRGNESSRRRPIPSKKTDCLQDRLLTWSTNTSGSLVPMILPRTMQTYSQLFFEMTVFRNSIQKGTKFFIDDTNPIRWYLGKTVQVKNTRMRNSRPYWNCTMWRFIRRRLDMTFTDWRQW